MNNPAVFFPINQREQAAQISAEVLLAIDVYKKLASTVREATELAQLARKQDSQSDDLNQHRAHSAVLIDGSRGTGKSSVLVNIAKYLKHYDPELEKRVHFLKPLDPTLLETTDDLFLNVIVAGLVSDDAIQVARLKGDDKANLFHEQLQRLGNTLERLESQRELRGLDKLRAFMGNQNLAQEVHLVFKAGLDLVGKELLVLPIDDVDTSLNRAFDNLEVIRKYLVSPYVLPVISGDLELYNDLTWRNFHGRLLKESGADGDGAVERAKDLAQEYQRKILPLQYRIEMPEVLHYLRSTQIGFYGANRKPVLNITMAHFYCWLEALLNERTNGSENSYLQPPVKNVRSLAQLVYSLQSQIPQLAQVITAEDLDPSQLRRQVVVPMKASAIRLFKTTYAAATSIVDKSANEAARRQAYKEFAAAQQRSPVFDSLRNLLTASQDLLRNYCQFAAEGGPAYLALAAQDHWRTLAMQPNIEDGVLNTFLFQPMSHSHNSLRHFGLHADTTTWHDLTGDRAPYEWLERLPAKTMIPYPSPEPGYALAKVKLNFEKPQEGFVAAILLHRNFYTTSKRATLACSGRVFELIVASFVSDVTSGDIANILQQSPFHSLAAVAATKIQLIATDDDSEHHEDSLVSEADADDVAALYGAQIQQLANKISEWRVSHGLKSHVPAPWFFYNVMNKVFNQATIFNAPQATGSNPDRNVLKYLSELAPKVFNSIWAAIGSFEKGDIFGLPPIIAQVNVGEGKAFRNSELYTRNIAPFVGARSEASGFGKATRAYTYMMADHPLRDLMQGTERPSALSPETTAAAAVTTTVRKRPKGASFSSPLLTYLNQKLDTNYTVFRSHWILTRALKRKDWGEIVKKVQSDFSSDRYYKNFLDVANAVATSG